MSDVRAAYRYATALLQVAEESKKLDEVSRDLSVIEKLTNDSREFRLFLKSPVVNSERKKRAFGEILNGKIGAVTEKFILLLTSKGREQLLPEVVRQFGKLRDLRLGILHVSARTAVAFSPDQEKRLTGQLENATKKKIRLSFVVDPSIKGGFTVQHDDTVWDASVRHQLEVLRERFVNDVP